MCLTIFDYCLTIVDYVFRRYLKMFLAIPDQACLTMFDYVFLMLFDHLFFVYFDHVFTYISLYKHRDFDHAIFPSKT
jgi:dipeptide/tripeptide permease